MNCRFFIIIFQAFFFYKHTTGNEAQSNLIKALLEIIYDVNFLEMTTVNFIDSTGSTDWQNELIPKLNNECAVRVLKSSFITIAKKQKWNFNIFNIESIKSLNDTMESFSNDCFNYAGYYIIIIKDVSINEIQKAFLRLWDFYIYNVNLVVNKLNAVDVLTFIPFSSTGCNSTSPIKIAEISEGQVFLRPKSFFPNKMENFHGCKLKLTTFESLAPSVLKNDFSNGTYMLYGRDVDVYSTLATEFNITFDVFYIIKFGGWGAIFANGTATGSIDRAIHREADAIIGNLYLKYDRSRAMDYSYVYFQDQIVLMQAPGQPLSTFQKLIRPFEPSVWLMLSITVIFGFTIIALLQLQSKIVKDFIIGQNIKNPYMNILIGAFGGSQHVLPKQNFSRSLLMMFLLFCLVIRSLYQGSLYQFLQANDNEKEPQSIQEMYERDYQFYLITSYDDMTKDNIYMNGSRRVMISPDELKAIMTLTLNPSFKGGLMIALSQVLYKNQVNFKSFLYKICRVSSLHVSFVLFYSNIN